MQLRPSKALSTVILRNDLLTSHPCSHGACHEDLLRALPAAHGIFRTDKPLRGAGGGRVSEWRGTRADADNRRLSQPAQSTHH